MPTWSFHTAPYGIATAASIWNTGAIGAAVAFERYEIALALVQLCRIALAGTIQE
jgi:putative Mg2+ transporter-C (MgtC) family protein